MAVVISAIGISFLFGFLNYLENIFFAIFAWTCIPTAIFLFIYCLVIFIKYHSDASDDQKNYMHRRYRRRSENSQV